MKNTFRFSPWFWRLLFAAALVVVAWMTEARAADCGCGAAVAHVSCVQVAKPQADSWVFARSRYSHDPETGARVAQYAMKPPVEPLPDQRAVTSGYRRTRTVLRGADGSADTTYQVQNYGNGRGGMDAEWERFHDAWRGSTAAGGQFFGYSPFGYGYGGFPGFGGFPGVGPGGFGNPAFFNPGLRSQPPYGFGPGFGRPDPGRLDPDATDGYRDPRFRTPDRRFFNPGLPPVQTLPGPGAAAAGT